MAIVVVGLLPLIYRYLLAWPQDQWLVDIEVYRWAGVSILTGRPIYTALTEAPQLLPFTYPPFAAVLAVPFALVPFPVAGIAWTGLQVLADAAIVWFAGWRLLRRLAGWAPVAAGAITAILIQLQPLQEGIRFGQVNAFLVLAVLLDLRDPRPRIISRVPPGVLVGLATAVKLVPGVFIVHYLICRRWREAGYAIAAAATATISVALLLPQASFAFWGGALQDPNRLGPNAGYSNQSLRGVLLRIGPDGLAGDAIWLVLVAVVGTIGFLLGRRMWRQGNSVGEVAVIGLLAALLSPVAWIHHYHYVAVIVMVFLAAGPVDLTWRGWWHALRHPDQTPVFGPGLWFALVVIAWFMTRGPWIGAGMGGSLIPDIGALILQNSGALMALVMLAMLWRISHPALPQQQPPDAPPLPTHRSAASPAKASAVG